MRRLGSCGSNARGKEHAIRAHDTGHGNPTASRGLLPRVQVMHRHQNTLQRVPEIVPASDTRARLFCCGTQVTPPCVPQVERRALATVVEHPLVSFAKRPHTAGQFRVRLAGQRGWPLRTAVAGPFLRASRRGQLVASCNLTKTPPRLQTNEMP